MRSIEITNLEPSSKKYNLNDIFSGINSKVPDGQSQQQRTILNVLAMSSTFAEVSGGYKSVIVYGQLVPKLLDGRESFCRKSTCGRVV